MKTGLILMLILFPLIVSSQKSTINQTNQTVTLDKIKTIDVAKIIQNEKRLLDYISDLEDEVVKLNDSVSGFVTRNNNAIKSFERMFDHIVVSNKKVSDLMNEQLEIEKELRKFGVYGYYAIGGNQNGLQSMDFGLVYANNKKLFSFTVDPLLFKGVTYKIGFGLKIF